MTTRLIAKDLNYSNDKDCRSLQVSLMTSLNCTLLTANYLHITSFFDNFSFFEMKFNYNNVYLRKVKWPLMENIFIPCSFKCYESFPCLLKSLHIKK